MTTMQTYKVTEPGAPNQDGMYPDDIRSLAVAIDKHPRRIARQLFPDRPNGYVTATINLGHYAWNKYTAMVCRLDGRVAIALIYERICDRIYEKLPEFARW